MVVWIYFVVACLLVLPLVAWAVWRRVVLWRDTHSRRLAALWSLSGSDPLAEPGVSVVADFDTTRRIEALMSLDYLRYEVVVVGDVERRAELRELVGRYAMIDVGSPVVEPHLQRSSRRLYRSRESRFRRLVVVDTVAPTSAERFDCGLAVRTYDHVLPLHKGVWLRADALRTMVWRMVEQGPATGVIAPLLMSEGACGRAAELWQFVGARVAQVTLVDGDSVSSLGGFEAFAERGQTPLKGCVDELGRRGADVVELNVAVGRNTRCVGGSLFALAEWTMLAFGCVLLALSDEKMRGIVIGSMVLMVVGGVAVSVLGRAFGRESGSSSRWLWVWVAPFVVRLRRKRYE